MRACLRSDRILSGTKDTSLWYRRRKPGCGKGRAVTLAEEGSVYYAEKQRPQLASTDGTNAGRVAREDRLAGWPPGPSVRAVSCLQQRGDPGRPPGSRTPRNTWETSHASGQGRSPSRSACTRCHETDTQIGLQHDRRSSGLCREDYSRPDRCIRGIRLR